MVIGKSAACMSVILFGLCELRCATARQTQRTPEKETPVVVEQPTKTNDASGSRDDSAKRKISYEDEVARRLERLDGQIATLRVSLIQATGAAKQRLEDGIWNAERQMVDIRNEFSILKDEGIQTWEHYTASLNEKLNHVEASVKGDVKLAH